MLTGLASPFDPYGRQARLFPGLLTVFPVLLCALAWYPELLSGVGSTLLTICSSCGLLYGLSSLARTKGKQVEERLLNAWGGWPTTLALRHTNRDLDSHTRQRYHTFLANHAKLTFPDAASEERNPAAADAVYASAIKWLKERTRSKEYTLVEKENAQYGFRRNLRGMKGYGVTLCMLALVVCASGVFITNLDLPSQLTERPRETLTSILASQSMPRWSALVADISAIGGWLLIANDAWVRQAGFQYAEALLACCDRIGITSSGPGRRKAS
ncbi:hypothetical protein IVB11_02015 [Bradyrhizobium sp. 177]|uniref:hypothetical protein n=1 Tax=Bradyrhizobium sp. 177 TaxID=2782647 RepID=UPI001FF8317E|nr:hypothetical protein [Bradyrhizobium sp. 177]MCK1547855.1 hypothetical protein [Bradyrhizobium sp. 177]